MIVNCTSQYGSTYILRALNTDIHFNIVLDSDKNPEKKSPDSDKPVDEKSSQQQTPTKPTVPSENRPRAGSSSADSEERKNINLMYFDTLTKLREKDRQIEEKNKEIERLIRKEKKNELDWEAKLSSLENRLKDQSIQIDDLHAKLYVKRQNNTTLQRRIKRLQEQADEGSDGGSSSSPCSVCLTSSKDSALIPCGHCFCNDCAESLATQNNDLCAVCRKQFSQIVRIYL